MERRPLGKTGVEVSVLGFGAAPLGQEYGALDEAEGIQAVRHAIERGIDFFDTAPYYGRTQSEERLGRALTGRRDEVFLATKCCRYGKRDFDFSAERVARSIDESLARLRTEYVDLFQVHDVEFGDHRQIVAETLPALRAVQASGKARFIGITGLPVHMLRALAEEFPVDTVLSYTHYDLLVRDLDDVLAPLARETGVGLINASALHMGVLTDAGPPPWHPAPAEVLEVGRAISQLCRERGRSVVAVALRFSLDHPDVATTLVGMQTVTEVDQNLAVLATASDPALLAEIDALVAPVLNRTWHEGRPANAPPVS